MHGVQGTLRRRAATQMSQSVAPSAVPPAPPSLEAWMHAGRSVGWENPKCEGVQRKFVAAISISEFGGTNPASHLLAEAMALAATYNGYAVSTCAGFDDKFANDWGKAGDDQQPLLADTLHHLNRRGLTPQWLSGPPDPQSIEALAVLTLATLDRAVGLLESAPAPTAELRAITERERRTLVATRAQLVSELPTDKDELADTAFQFIFNIPLIASLADPECVLTNRRLVPVAERVYTLLDQAGVPHSHSPLLAGARGLYRYLGWEGLDEEGRPSQKYCVVGVNQGGVSLLNGAHEICDAFENDGRISQLALHETIHSGQVGGDVPGYENDLCEAATETLAAELVEQAGWPRADSGYYRLVYALSELAREAGSTPLELARELSAVPARERAGWLAGRLHGHSGGCDEATLRSRFQALCAQAPPPAA